MIDLSTVKELRALRLPGMARELESQLEEPQRYKALSFEDRLALLVDAENVSRRKNTIQRRIHEARLSESQACVEAIEYYEDRELDQGLITKLATCAYIRDNHHVVLKGATGAGKSYIANALGVAACRQLYKVRYVRMPDLLNEYAVAKSLNTQNKVKKTYARFDLLIQCHLDKIKKECKDKETAFSKCHLEELKTIRSYKLMEKGKDCMTKKQVYICF